MTKEADVFPSVLIETLSTHAYDANSLLLVFFSNFILLQNNSDAKFGETMLSSDAGTK